jgi:hypothetical protein
MGLLSPRGQDDDDDDAITVAGLGQLDDPEGDEVVYELEDWSEADRRVLRERLEQLVVPHTWDGDSLVVAAADEAWVERIMDQVDEALIAADEEPEDDTQVAYDLSAWDDESCMQLLDTLSAEAIPYALEEDELLVAADDEARVDEIVTAISTPGATLRAGGPVSFEAMSELFVAADQLAGDAESRDGKAALIDGARTASASSPPYGMEAGWWDGVVARAGALADLLETDEPDAELVTELAAALRDELRPVV